MSEPTVYDISVTATGGDRPALKQTTTAYTKGAAAFLRSVADEIDPPRPVATCRCFKPHHPRAVSA